MKARAPKFELNLTAEEQHIVEQTLKTGNLNLFSERFFRLPNGGTRWLPGDSLGHYRHLFDYELLYSAWKTAGKPDDQLLVKTPEYQYGLRVLWEGDEPHFLLPHGYLFLDWSLPIIDRKTNVGLVEAGTGVAKTSSVAVAALITCALFPDYNFLNAAPTDEQSNLMIVEMDKWVTTTPFIKFVIPTTRGELYVKKPSATVEIASPFDPRYPSHFVCKTTGRNANNALGKSIDWTNLDEIQLMDHVDEAMPKIVSRSRATRATGTPRDSRLTMLTNPGDNPQLGLVKDRVQRIIDKDALIERGEIKVGKDEPRIKAALITNLYSLSIPARG